MSRQPPKLIAINHDEYHTQHIGRTKSDNQFFLTNPFVPARKDDKGREFLALYIFDSGGTLVEAKIDDLGTREGFDLEHARNLSSERLTELGPIECGRIEVRPFQVDRFGQAFGLILRAPDDEEDPFCVEVQPGNYMAFFEPWDRGNYDT